MARPTAAKAALALGLDAGEAEAAPGPHVVPPIDADGYSRVTLIEIFLYRHDRQNFALSRNLCGNQISDPTVRHRCDVVPVTVSAR